jgi:hypothetical protein
VTVSVRVIPRIATSGGFTMGVKAVPPIPPRLLIVMDAPPISSGPILRACARAGEIADLLRDRPQALAVGVADDRHHQPVRRVHGDADMDVSLRISVSPSAESEALNRGKAKRARERRDVEGKRRQLDAARLRLGLPGRAQASMAETSARS